MQNIQALILAAGKSTRFKTGKSKLVQKVCGQELILYSAKLLEQLYIPMTVVVGFQKEDILSVLHEHMHKPFNVIVQDEQRGTGDAVRCTRNVWLAENILILNGDVPLLTEDLINDLYKKHQTSKATVTFVTSHTDMPDSYGRVIEKDGKYAIVEKSELTADHDEAYCINAGIYLIRRDFLDAHINTLEKNNNKQEFYLTDLIKIASDSGLGVQTLQTPFDTIRGINNFKELWAVEHIKRSQLIEYWMMHGVRFKTPQNTLIDLNVSIGTGSEIGAGVQLLDGTQVGTDCTIGDYSIIEKTKIADRSLIKPFTLITDSTVETAAEVGPYAHIRNHAVIGSQAIIGNFVEIKKSIIGAHTKAKHLTYLGDAHVGQNVNIGAGTITCNHNGVKKNPTVIHDGAYIGSNNSLIAPVTIGKNAYTAAGSTITDDVPADALAIARSKQTNKEGYAFKLRSRGTANLAPDQSNTILPFVAAVKLGSE
jgi:bifunctional UDP-N-acetylglucosamine pyrophosphorylase/glucosamine-1-phosphate N-acetyltransferase